MPCAFWAMFGAWSDNNNNNKNINERRAGNCRARGRATATPPCQANQLRISIYRCAKNKQTFSGTFQFVQVASPIQILRSTRTDLGTELGVDSTTCLCLSLSLNSASCGSWQPQKCCVPILLVILTPPTRKQLELAPAFALSNFPIESAPDSHSQLRCLFVSTNSLLVCFFLPLFSLLLSLALSVSFETLSK